MRTRTKLRNPRAPVPGSRLSLQAAAEQLRLVHPELRSPGIGFMPPVTSLQQRNTARLLPARYSDSVLTRLADNADDLAAVFALDLATNERLAAEADGLPGLPARELVFDLPYARIINAAFAHPHPQGARFSTPERGAWYAAFELATAKAEVLFHRSVQLGEIKWDKPESLDYDHYQADFAGGFHDLRPIPAEEHEAARGDCLAPDSYVASQDLSARLLAAGALGVVYPSTRRDGGTCIACFRPAAVANVRKREMHRLTWYPDRPATFRRVPRAGTSTGEAW